MTCLSILHFTIFVIASAIFLLRKKNSVICIYRGGGGGGVLKTILYFILIFTIYLGWTFLSTHMSLTYWGRVTHICVSKLTIIGSDNGLFHGRRQAITWTNAGTLLIGPLRTNFSETSIGIHIFSFNKMNFKMSRNWQPFCLGFNVLMRRGWAFSQQQCVARRKGSRINWISCF